MQPAPQGVTAAHRCGLASQYQESGLEGVFDVVLVLEYGAACCHHHRAMPRHQGLKRRPILERGIARPGAVTSLEADQRSHFRTQVAKMLEGSVSLQALVAMARLLPRRV